MTVSFLADGSYYDEAGNWYPAESEDDYGNWWNGTADDGSSGSDKRGLSSLTRDDEDDAPPWETQKRRSMRMLGKRILIFGRRVQAVLR